MTGAPAIKLDHEDKGHILGMVVQEGARVLRGVSWSRHHISARFTAPDYLLQERKINFPPGLANIICGFSGFEATPEPTIL